MARLTQLTQELRQEIQEAWQASLSRMFDSERSLQSLVIPLADEPNTQWYSLPNGAFMILRNALIGGSANLQFISKGYETIPELESAREQIIEAMKQYRLKRISVIYPTVLPWRDFKLLGFKHEGRIRRSVLFDGEWIDAEVLGALENEIGISRRRRRKRYRPNKQENINATASNRSDLSTSGATTAAARPEGASTERSSSSGSPSGERPDVEPEHNAGPSRSKRRSGFPRPVPSSRKH